VHLLAETTAFTETTPVRRTVLARATQMEPNRAACAGMLEDERRPVFWWTGEEPQAPPFFSNLSETVQLISGQNRGSLLAGFSCTRTVGRWGCCRHLCNLYGGRSLGLTNTLLPVIATMSAGSHCGLNRHRHLGIGADMDARRRQVSDHHRLNPDSRWNRCGAVERPHMHLNVDSV
jgi:hypothetical protein